MPNFADSPERLPNQCPYCGYAIRFPPSNRSGCVSCTNCGGISWYENGMVEPLTASFSEALTQFDLTDSLDLDVVGLIPESVARENRLLVLANARNGLIIAAAEEVDEDVLEKLQFILNRRIQILQVSRDWIEHKIDEYYS